MAQFTINTLIDLIRIQIDDNLQSDGRTFCEYDSDNVFYLSHQNVSSSAIKVYKNGSLLTTGYTYNSDLNAVIITASLTKGDAIVILYSYYNIYSDTQIKNWIKASFLELSRRRYSKLFYLNSSDEIVTSNGLNPTDREGNLIATITAILIDPQNQKIRTPEYTIESTEHKSRMELIDLVFLSFTQCYGETRFLSNDTDNTNLY